MRFGILGPLRVSAGSDEVVFARRERVLLAVLLLHANRSVSVERVVDAIWGERPPADSTGQVHSSVYRLRKRLAAVGGSRDVIVTDPAGYRVRVDPESLDLAQFRGLRDQARAAAGSGNLDHAREGYRAALDLWRGRALDGTDSDVIRHAAAGLDEEHVQAAEECIEVELALGRSREVVAELTELVGQHPHREGLHRALMVALYRAGRQADALAAYRSARASLREELGLEPGPELQRLHQAILNRDPELDQPATSAPVEPAGPGQLVVPRELPADVAGFTGRADALKTLDGLLASVPDGSPAPVVISAIAGTAGIGKTALAVRWAHRVADRFPDGQLYLNLRGYEAGSPVRPMAALVALLRGLGTPPEKIPTDQERAAGLYRSRLAGRRVLVVLDNASSAGQIRPLLPGSAGCLVLVTSRDRLQGLVARDGAQRLTLNVLAADEAVALLTRLLGGERVRSEPEAARALAAACAHLPLALRVAAANLIDHPHRTIAAYVTELTTGDRLSGLRADSDEETAVRATFDLSYERLPTEAQRMFRMLGLVPGPDTTTEAAAALAGTTIAEAKRLLTELASAHLVDEHRVDRYSSHDLLRLYAHECSQLEDSEASRQQARRRLLSWHLENADAAASFLYPLLVRLPLASGAGVSRSVSPSGFHDSVAALAWLDDERQNTVAAIQSAMDHGLRPLGWLLADRLRGFFWSRRHIVDWLTVSKVALAAAESEGDQKAQAAMKASIGNAYQALGRYTDAIACYVVAADRAGVAGWLEGKGSSLANIGVALTSKGDHQTALNYFHQAFELYEQSEWRGGMALILGNLSNLYGRIGQLRRSRELRAREMAALRELGLGTGASMAYAAHNLGSVERDLGELASSMANLRFAAALFREAGNRFGEAHVLDTLAGTHLAQGRVAEAHELAQSAVELAGEMGDPRAESEAWSTLGDVHNQSGRHEDALACHLRAIELARRIYAPEAEIHALNGWATAAQHQSGRAEEAYAHAHEALVLARKFNYRMLEGRALTVLAEVLLAQCRYEEAAESAQLALENHRTTGHRLGEARSLTTLGAALHQVADPHALAHHDSARKLFVDLGAPVPKELEAR